jgi:invasion protein IalB
MNIKTMTAKTAIALVAAAILSVGAVAINAQNSFDPARLYGSVKFTAGKNADTTVLVPTFAFGRFNEIGLPSNAKGTDILSVLKIVKISGPTGLEVELRSARLERTKEAGSVARVELRFKSVPYIVTGTPVEITLENAQNGNRTSFFVMAQGS